MDNVIGKRVELLIFEKGFPSVRKFAEYLKEFDPENYVSEDTISNVIKGKGLQNSTIVTIAKGLGISVDCLTADNIPLLDDYLAYEVRPLKEKKCKEYRNFEGEQINNLEWIKRLYDISKRIYPTDIGDIYSEYEYQITTLAEFIIYFPLCRIQDVMEVIFRIRGSINNYESYFFEQFRRLYATIPNIPAKKYADFQVIEMRLEHRVNLNENQIRLKEMLIEFKQSELYKVAYRQYSDIVDKTDKYYRARQTKDILCMQIPEIYQINSF